MSTSVFLQCSFYCSVSTSSGLGDDVPENIVSKHWERINTNSIFLLALRVCLFFFFYYSSKQPNAAMLVVIVFGSDLIQRVQHLLIFQIKVDPSITESQYQRVTN